MAEVEVVESIGHAGAGAGGGALSGALAAGLASGGVSLAVTLVIGSLFGSNQQKQINRQILDQRAIVITKLNSAGSVYPMIFGQGMLPGYPVWARVNDDLPTAINTTPDNIQKFGHLAPRSGQSVGGGPRRQYLCVEYAFGVDQVYSVENLLVDDNGIVPVGGPAAQGFRNLTGHVLGEYRREGGASQIAKDFTGGAGTASFTDGSIPDIEDRHRAVRGVGDNSRDDNSKFTGLSYVTCVFKKELDVKDEPKFQDIPNLNVFVSAGVRTKTVNDDQTGIIDTAATFDDNAVRCFLKYFLNDEMGPKALGEVDEDDFALDTWARAEEIADRIFRGPGALFDDVDELEGFPDYSGVTDAASAQAYYNGLTAEQQQTVDRVARQNNMMTTPFGTVPAVQTAGQRLLWYLNNALTTGPLSSIASYTDFSKLSLRKHRMTGAIKSDQAVQDVLTTIVYTLFPGSILYHRAGDRKIAFYVPDGVTPTRDQVDIELGEGDLLNDVEEQPQDASDRLNQITARLVNMATGFVEDTITWPPEGSPLYEQWVEEDGGERLHAEIQLPYTNNQASAIGWINSTIRISRRPHFILELPKWAEMLDPGTKLRVTDPRSNLAGTVISVEQTSYTPGTEDDIPTVQVSGIEFDNHDYRMLVDLDGSVDPPQELDFTLVDPTAVEHVAQGFEVNVTITDPNTKIDDKGYEIQRKIGDADWEPLVYLNTVGTQTWPYTATRAGSYLHRVRKVDVLDRKGGWVQTAQPLQVDELSFGNTDLAVIFKRSATVPANNDRPTGNATFTFATNTTVIAAADRNGWSTSIPDGEDQLYARYAVATGSGLTATIRPVRWGQPIAQTGAPGESGLNYGVAELFTASDSSSVPTRTTLPASVEYDFTSGKITTTAGLGIWLKQLGNPLAGKYKYVARAPAVSRENTDTVPRSEFVIGAYAADGDPGPDGRPGFGGIGYSRDYSERLGSIDGPFVNPRQYFIDANLTHFNNLQEAKQIRISVLKDTDIISPLSQDTRSEREYFKGGGVLVGDHLTLYWNEDLWVDYVITFVSTNDGQLTAATYTLRYVEHRAPDGQSAIPSTVSVHMQRVPAPVIDVKVTVFKVQDTKPEDDDYPKVRNWDPVTRQFIGDAGNGWLDELPETRPVGSKIWCREEIILTRERTRRSIQDDDWGPIKLFLQDGQKGFVEISKTDYDALVAAGTDDPEIVYIIDEDS